MGLHRYRPVLVVVLKEGVATSGNRKKPSSGGWRRLHIDLPELGFTLIHGSAGSGKAGIRTVIPLNGVRTGIQPGAPPLTRHPWLPSFFGCLEILMVSKSR